MSYDQFDAREAKAESELRLFQGVLSAMAVLSFSIVFLIQFELYGIALGVSASMLVFWTVVMCFWKVSP